MRAMAAALKLFLPVLLLAATLSHGCSDFPLFPPRRFLRKKFANISGKKMAYVEVGKGDPIVFLHGNPTSSFLWRNVMPHLEGRGRLIAPDLIGMGDSDKLDNSDEYRYTFLEHSNYLFQLLEKLGVKERVTFVIHDWGSALGFYWSYLNRRNPNAVKGIAFFEGIVTSAGSFDGFPEDLEQLFNPVRGPTGEKLILQDNFFIEEVLPSAILRNLTKRELNVYRRPYLNAGEDRRPMLTWPRQIPIRGEPREVAAIVRKYSRYLARSNIPKLFIDAKPGILSSGMRGELRRWKRLERTSVMGLHFLQEDCPVEIGKAVARWLP